MRSSILLASAAFGCMGLVSGTAQAQSVAFGAGTAFPQAAYRHLFDCWYNQAQGSPGKPGPFPKAIDCPAFNMSGYGGLILYATSGSANGKLVLRTNNKASIGASGNVIPYTDMTWGINNTSDYDGIQFALSDDVINTADMTAWNAAGNPATFGNIIQIPAFIASVALGFNGKDQTGALLNILPSAPPGGTSGLNLSRNALCGIVSGHITKWNNPILTALNGGILGTGNITFVHRADSTYSTFLFSNALAEQCRYEIGPMSETNPAIVSYAFWWTDLTAACPLPLARGAYQNNWPDQFIADQCGNAIPNPGGGTFANASGNVNLAAQVSAINGAIGYAPVDFWLPSIGGTLRTANLQSQWDITAATGQFQPPTFQGMQTAMNSARLQFASAADRANALMWRLQGVVPNPTLLGAYPIAGFTWIEMYQCYQVHSNSNNPLLWVMTWLKEYLYVHSVAHAILRRDGYAELSGPWLAEVHNLLNDNNYGPRYTSDVDAVNCAGKVGAY
jgi:phosphate transport system substrate-binding protein